jgi:hypothetical protein
MAFYDLGLLNDFLAGYKIFTHSVHLNGSFVKYGKWGTTPLFFSPLYRSGFRTDHEITAGSERRKFFATLSIDHHDDYFNPLEPETFNDFFIRFGILKPLNKYINARVSCEVNTAVSPSMKFEASVDDSISKLLVWQAKGGLYSDLHPYAQMQLRFRPLKMLTAFTDVSWNYTPAERKYNFQDYTRTVHYVPRSYEALAFHASLTYADTLAFPLTVSAWYDYYEHPLWEKFHTVEDQLIIEQDTVWEATPWHAGGKASYALDFRKLSAMLWGNAAISARNSVQRFMAPLNVGIDAGFGRQRGDSLYAGIRIEYRQSAVLRYKNINSDEFEELVSPTHIPVTCVLRVPAVIPFTDNRLKTNIWIEAGPINLRKEFIDNPTLETLRVKKHPLGNPVGPAIAVRLDGFFR